MLLDTNDNCMIISSKIDYLGLTLAKAYILIMPLTELILSNPITTYCNSHDSSKRFMITVS